MAEEPEYADPDLYIERADFRGEYRDLWWNRDFLALVAARLELSSVRQALDVGCGAGHWTRTVSGMLDTDAELVGVDAEPRFLDLARERGGDERRTEFVVGKAESLPFEDATFDLVTCQTLLIHVEDAEVAVREMARVLKPGGTLLACEPDNLAGTAAHLTDSTDLRIEDRTAIFRFQATCQRGKAALGRGNGSIGGLLPGVFARVGLADVDAWTNDRCLVLYPPYESPAMRLALDQELAWAKDHVSSFVGSRHDARLFFLAGGGDEADFDALWEVTARWMDRFVREIGARTYHAARGYVGYLVFGRKR